MKFAHDLLPFLIISFRQTDLDPCPYISFALSAFAYLVAIILTIHYQFACSIDPNPSPRQNEYSSQAF